MSLFYMHVLHIVHVVLKQDMNAGILLWTSDFQCTVCRSVNYFESSELMYFLHILQCNFAEH